MVKNVPINKLNYESKTNNKSQIFIFDLIFSAVIIIVSLGIAFTYYNNTLTNEDIYEINSQILNGFTQTQINTLNGEEIRKLFISGYIKNIHNTIGQQVIYFIEEGNDDLAINLTKIFVKDYINNQMNFNLSLINETGYSKTLFTSSRNNIPFKKSQITSVTKRKIISFVDYTSSYKIYTFEVKIWV